MAGLVMVPLAKRSIFTTGFDVFGCWCCSCSLRTV